MTTDAVTPLRHRMIEDMNARKLCAGTQRGHIHSCKHRSSSKPMCLTTSLSATQSRARMPSSI